MLMLEVDDSRQTSEDFAMRAASFLLFVLSIACLCLDGTVTTATAATVYRCVGKDGVVAFQDHACSSGGKQTVRDIVSHDPPVAVIAAERVKPTRQTRSQASGLRQRRVAEPISFECRTNTGMVFYRHSRCPAALVDGTDSNGRSRRLLVSSQRLDRREACRRMRNGARDGNEFDERVSTYERNLGRDTCRNY